MKKLTFKNMWQARDVHYKLTIHPFSFIKIRNVARLICEVYDKAFEDCVEIELHERTHANTLTSYVTGSGFFQECSFKQFRIVMSCFTTHGVDSLLIIDFLWGHKTVIPSFTLKVQFNDWYDNMFETNTINLIFKKVFKLLPEYKHGKEILTYFMLTKFDPELVTLIVEFLIVQESTF